MPVTSLPAEKSPVVSIDSGDHRRRVLERRDALVADHLYLVEPIARRLHNSLPPSFDLDDLVATGNLALIHTATRYRPRQHSGTPFAIYARPRIRGAMLDTVRRRHYEEATRPSIDEAAIWEVRDRGATIETCIDEGRLRQRLRTAISELPARKQAVVAAYYSENLKRPNLRDATGNYQRRDHLATVGSALGLPEWAVIREHAEAIVALRRKLDGPSHPEAA